MVDTILGAIEEGRITPQNISFDRLRQVAGIDSGDEVRARLNRGVAVLRSVEELDQYLFTYGLMVSEQWSTMLDNVSFVPQPTQIIDYGCGQGLGTALLFDRLGKGFSSELSKLVLIEPSPVALARAEAVLSCYEESLEIVGVNKYLDDVQLDDLAIDDLPTTIHVFSNILDINTFDHVGLFNKLFAIPGRHQFLVVSHDRDFKGGTQRLVDMQTLIDQLDESTKHRVVDSTSELFPVRGDMRAIAVQAELEVF